MTKLPGLTHPLAVAASSDEGKPVVCLVASVVHLAPGSAGGPPASGECEPQGCLSASVGEVAPGSAGGPPASCE